MEKWMAIFAFCSVTVFARSTLPGTSYDVPQELIPNRDCRPTSETVTRKHAHNFKSIRPVRIDDVSGGWARAHKTHFTDGGTIDQIHGK